MSPVMSENSHETTGEINFQRKNTKKIKRNVPFRSRKFRASCMLFGKREKRILDPSSGGIGTRLKVARTKFIKTIMEAM
jgi:hypothetical protein